jgi:hypothetical protein
MTEEEKKIIKTKVYTLTVDIANDGTSRLTRLNDGFNTIELIGLCTQVLHDLCSPNLPKMEFNEVKRQIVKD